MDTETATAIMEFIIEFTKANNLAESDSKSTTALVVHFDALNHRLKIDMQKEYIKMLRNYDELFDFLMTKGRHIYDKKLNTKWTYRIMPGKKYSQDNRCKKNLFLPLKQKRFYRFNLFVLYHEPLPLKYYGTEEEYYTLTEKLTKDIEVCLEKNTSIEKKYRHINHLADYINTEFQDFFDDPKITVEIIGSTHTKLDLDDSDLNLGIRISPSEIKKDASLCDTQNWGNTLYDPHYLAQCLRKMGMKATLPIPSAKRTQFTEPKTGLQCFIGVDDGLVFERDTMIIKYLKLDKRVKPLIIAILKLSRSCYMSALSTYSYVLMTLHFLMNVLENPVILNLQNLPVECNSTDCFLT
ncbi:hypothetical protein INT48_003958 [Thamnidium elegans]|uniref:Poly(A) RNA polymerase mitochondrial-like central palm domain-containing protein n=1 Tax=Thamnidium elegans TaxID=101142 RepID=A0A8H7SWT0_9FUNG|nr:hypothetical protein INT48_003958 [Thamnidium elegans]